METSFEVDEHHWWYRARRTIIRQELERLPLAPELQILDAGCGSGRTLVELAELGYASGVEPDAKALNLARPRGNAEVRAGSLEAVPWPDASFDLITCLDVVEHTPDDVVSLTELRRVARPGAWLLLTVPAYQWLWSRHDVDNQHFRRYSRRTLRAALACSGWKLERLTSFNTLLLGPAVAVRMAQRAGVLADNGAASDLEIGPAWLNDSLARIMSLEAHWLGSGRTLPVGLSLMAVARSPTR